MKEEWSHCCGNCRGSHLVSFHHKIEWWDWFVSHNLWILLSEGCIYQRITRSYFMPGDSDNYYAYWKYVQRIKICDVMICLHLIMIIIKKTRVIDVNAIDVSWSKEKILTHSKSFFFKHTSWECSYILLSVVCFYYFFNV